MADISSEIIFDTPGVLEKLSGENTFKASIYRAIYEEFGGDGDENQSGIQPIGASGIRYPVDKEMITTNPDNGTIEFSSYDGTYAIRKFQESDSEWFLYGLPLEPKMMEDIMAKDEQVEMEQSVEALTNPDSGELVAVIFTVNDLGIFARSNGKWVPMNSEEADKYDGSNITDIKVDMWGDLVAKFDAGQKMNETDLEAYAALEETE
jgi:hypothetical protein